MADLEFAGYMQIDCTLVPVLLRLGRTVEERRAHILTLNERYTKASRCRARGFSKELKVRRITVYAA